MGRQQYLTRLALGRSAFQDSEDDAPDLPASTAANGTSTPESQFDGDYIQQYDSKGRPINPRTESSNAEMRRAQNSVLALVGVVEQRERREESDETNFRYIYEARQKVLKAENERGEDLSVLVELIRIPFDWWVQECLLKRCIIGFYHLRMPFVDILGGVGTEVRIGGLKAIYGALFPGFVVSLLHYSLRMLLEMGIDEAIVGPLMANAMREASRKTRQILSFAFGIFRQALLVGIDLALLPLGYYAMAQTLGIAPALPLLPPLTLLLPWHKESFHSFGWRGLIGVPFLRNLVSPALLLLVKGAFRWESDDDDETPANSAVVFFRTPAINTAPHEVHSPLLLRDPLGWTLDKAYRIRAKVLYLGGWVLWYPDHLKRIVGWQAYDLNVSLLDRDADVGDVKSKKYRSTSLGHTPAKFLAARIDNFIFTILTLPFETLMLRAIANTYMSSTLPKTLTALQNAPNLYPVTGTGFLGAVRAPGGLAEVAYYASKLVLCLALKASMDSVLFAGIYRIVRRQGINCFDWGSRFKIGRIYYATPPPSP